MTDGRPVGPSDSSSSDRAVVGSLPVGSAPRRSDRPTGRPSLVIQTAFLGDVVLTTPLLQALADRWGPVDVVTTPGAAPLLETHPAVRAVIPYAKRGADAGFGGFLRLARRLRAERYARVYLAHRSWRSAALAIAAQIPERIGFADAPAAVTYTVRVPRPRSGHEVERLAALGGGAGVEPSLGITPADLSAAGAWLAARGVTGPFVAIAPGSIWGTKRWPYYPALAAEGGFPVVVVGGPEDRELGEAVRAAAPERVANAAGELSLRASAALIERAAVLVTNDSAPLHLATATRTPVVAIFGPTVPAFGFGPRGAEDRVIEHPALACRPCSAHGPERCPLGHHRCMRELAPAQVLRAVAEVVAATEGDRALRAGH